jgi:hypothetical protein
MAGLDAKAPTRLGAAIVLARRFRSPAPPGADDVMDPYRRNPETYARVYAVIQQALAPMVRATSATPTEVHQKLSEHGGALRPG